MRSYLENLVKRFLREYEGPLRKVATPYPPDHEWSPADDEPGRFQSNAASYTASVLFASLVCRHDLSVAVQRLCSHIAHWTVCDDTSLIRLMSYIFTEPGLELVGTLSPEDISALELETPTGTVMQRPPRVLVASL